MDEKPANSARVQRIVRAPVDCTSQRSPFLLPGRAPNSFMFFSKAMHGASVISQLWLIVESRRAAKDL
jgi:hypothetical protein